MPSVVSLFKAVAESLIQVMTMLLQMLIQHLEVSSPNNLMEEAPLETTQQIQVMMEELQTQRVLLENINRQCQIQPGTSTAANPEPSKLVSKTKLTPGAKASQALESSAKNRKSQTPSSASAPMMWCLDESDNEVIVEEEELEIVHQVHRQVPVMMPSPQAVPFEEWGTHLVTWGKKHKGKSFEATIRVDPQYFDWCQSRFTSLTPEMQDFVRYGQMRLSRLSAQCEAASPGT